jgi:hypothetical protein
MNYSLNSIHEQIRNKLKEEVYPLEECSQCNGNGYYYPHGLYGESRYCHECDNRLRMGKVNKHADKAMEHIESILIRIAMNEDAEILMDFGALNDC